MRAHGDRCQECRLPALACMCELIWPLPCPVRVTILRHTLESKRNSNTGRLVARALEGSSVIEYGSPQASWNPEAFAQEETWLLYPSAGARVPQRLPKQLLVLDGSWGQARRMAQRIPELRGLPRLALPAPAQALPRLRNGQKSHQMSTAESVVAALRHLQQEAPAAHLESLLCELVRRFALPQRRGPQERKSQAKTASPVLRSSAQTPNQPTSETIP